MAVTLTHSRPFGVVERSGPLDLFGRAWARFAPKGGDTRPSEAPIAKSFIPSERVILNPKTAAQTDRDWQMLQSLDPNHPLRRTIQGKVAVKQAAMEQVMQGHEVSDRDAFNALWRQMNQHSKGNVLSQNLHAAMAVQLVAPISAKESTAQADKAALTGQPLSRQQKLHGSREAVNHKSAERNPEAAVRKHRQLKQVEQRVADIGKGVETADAPELIYRVNEAREVASGFGLKDPAALRRAEQMGQQMESRIAGEARSRLPGQASQSGDLEADLQRVRAAEEARKTELNRTAFMLTPVGLARGLLGKSAGRT